MTLQRAEGTRVLWLLAIFLIKTGIFESCSRVYWWRSHPTKRIIHATFSPNLTHNVIDGFCQNPRVGRRVDGLNKDLTVPARGRPSMISMWTPETVVAGYVVLL